MAHLCKMMRTKLFFLRCQIYTKCTLTTCVVELFQGIGDFAGACERCWGRCLPVCPGEYTSRPHPRQAKTRSGHDQWHRKVPRRATKEQATVRNSPPKTETRPSRAQEHMSSQANAPTGSALTRRSHTVKSEGGAGSAGYIFSATVGSC